MFYLCLYTGYTFDSKPDLVILLELLADVNHLWYQIGTVLRVPEIELESLQQSNKPDFVKINKVLQIWRDQCTTKMTWGNIIGAMKSRIVRQNCVAKEIQEYVLNTNLSGEIQSKRIVALNVSTSSKKHLSVPVEPWGSGHSMLLK